MGCYLEGNQKGVYMWEYGDQGTILVLVNAVENTDVLYYSLDEGQTWKEYKFSDYKVNIYDLATVPTDTARKFIIFAENPRIIEIYKLLPLISQTFTLVNVN